MACSAGFRLAMLAAAGVLVAGTQVAAPAHAAPARAAAGSTVQELGHLGGGQSWANDINNAGQVVGKSTTASGEEHAFLWDPKTSRMTDLGTPEVLGEDLPSFRSEATGINNLGQVVGRACPSESYGPCAGFVWSPITGRATYLGTYPDRWENVLPYAINDLGQIVGNIDYVVGSIDSGAAWWSPETGWKAISGPSGTGIRTAVDINNAGQVVGGGLAPYIFDLRTERVTFLPEGFYLWDYLAVNEAGVVVANSYSPIVWDTVSGEVVELTHGAVAEDINESGQVVGRTSVLDQTTWPEPHGAVWDRATGLNVMLPPLGDDVSSYANAINDSGQVAGTSVSASFRARAVVWPPTTFLESVVVTASADTYVNELAARTNYGASKSLATRGSVGSRYVSYLRFALPSAPSDATLVEATLRFRTSGETFAGSNDPQSVNLVTDSWSETRTTFQNRPSRGAQMGGIGSAPRRGTVYSVVLDTTAVRDRLGGTIDIALSGRTVSDGKHADSLWLNSRETNIAANRPQLTLTFAH